MASKGFHASDKGFYSFVSSGLSLLAVSAYVFSPISLKLSVETVSYTSATGTCTQRFFSSLALFQPSIDDSPFIPNLGLTVLFGMIRRQEIARGKVGASLLYGYGYRSLSSPTTRLQKQDATIGIGSADRLGSEQCVEENTHTRESILARK